MINSDLTDLSNAVIQHKNTVSNTNAFTHGFMGFANSTSNLPSNVAY